MLAIMQKTVTALRNEGVSYKGVLYGGLMIEGREPFVLEFNARFGDPETQPILFKMESDILPILTGVRGRRTRKGRGDRLEGWCIDMRCACLRWLSGKAGKRESSSGGWMK